DLVRTGVLAGPADKAATARVLRMSPPCWTNATPRVAATASIKAVGQPDADPCHPDEPDFHVLSSAAAAWSLAWAIRAARHSVQTQFRRAGHWQLPVHPADCR